MKLPIASLIALLAFANFAQAQTTLIVEGLIEAPASTSNSSNAKKDAKRSKKEVKKGKIAKGNNKASKLTQSKNPQTAAAPVVLDVISANYEAGTSGNAGSRTSGGGNAEAYAITRNMDDNSDDILQASQNGRVFNAAVISNRTGSNTSTIRMDRVYLSSYSTSMSNGQSVESFKIHFQSQSVN